jgi:hypothetical protein
MFSYSVKFVCGQNGVATPAQNCSPVRQGIYATEINIHNFNRDQQAQIEKRVLLLVSNDAPVGREPHQVQAKVFDKIVLPPDSATMDDCCRFIEMLHFNPAQLNIGFLELVSTVELNVTAVYTATDVKSASISIDVETIDARKF